MAAKALAEPEQSSVLAAANIRDATHQVAQLASAEGGLAPAATRISAGPLLEPTAELSVRDLMVLRSGLDGVPSLIEIFEALGETLGVIGGVDPSSATRALFGELAGKRS